MKNAARLFVAPWYLLGWMSHVYLALAYPVMYRNFGKTALIPALRSAWEAWIMPNIVFFALMLAVFEIVVGILLIGKGKQVKYGLIFSLFFNCFLVVLGLSGQASDWVSDFLTNRLPNLIFISIQIPLLFCTFEQSLAEGAASLFRRLAHE